MKKVMAYVLVLLVLSGVAYGESKTCDLKLNVYERLKISGFLPKRSNFEKAMIISDITAKLKLKQEDIVLYEIKSAENSISWNEKGSEAISFTFTETELQVLKDSLEEVNKKDEVEAVPAFIELYKKIKNVEAK
jgi:hypothetical protein